MAETARDYRRRVTALPEDLRRGGGDPFEVDVKDALARLREGYEELDGDELVMDAMAVNAVSQVVAQQDEWLDYQLSRVQVDPALLREKIRAMDERALSAALRCSQHLPAGIKQLHSARLRAAADYWIELVRWGAHEGLPAPPMLQGETEALEPFGDDLVGELQAWRERVARKLESGPVTYEEALSGSTGKERLKAAYMTSFMCASGEITLRYDPVRSAYVVSRAQGVPDSSVAIAL
ncbi:MAG: hypothetical protein JRN39_06710 [Nitrososphaerota archaeon]|nr:hypothetical protein [Nitrososphaerota archaeon]